ncbi:hypothetical protein A2U01_0043411, partial [Trifolium medium]|nr:hypothetical protein [Trifolium medium]
GVAAVPHRSSHETRRFSYHNPDRYHRYAHLGQTDACVGGRPPLRSAPPLSTTELISYLD